MSPEQKLFQAIVHQCVADAVAPPEKGPEYDRWRKRRARLDAQKGYERSEVGYADAWALALENHANRLVQFEKDQSQARRWLLSGSRDFNLICDLAGYDPEYIRGNAKKLERAGWQASASPELLAA